MRVILQVMDRLEEIPKKQPLLGWRTGFVILQSQGAQTQNRLCQNPDL